jgi:sulfoxide reductase heme-binding subunit YedZ
MLASLSLLAGAAVFVSLSSDDPLWRVSMATAYVGLALLGISLILGPWNVLRRRPNPVSTDLRRDVGIWTGLMSLVHLGVGLCVHLRGRPWLYFLYPSNESHALPVRYDLFGLANHTGLIAGFVLALGIAYQVIENRWRLPVFVTAFALVVLSVVGLQTIGARRYRTNDAPLSAPAGESADSA